jgi:hypothetical protein
LNDFTGSQIELDANCIERRAIFPRHLNDSVNLIGRQWNFPG